MSGDIACGRLNTAQIKDNFADLHPPLSDLQAQQESARCLFCHDAPCTEACPTDIDIPGFIRKISTGNLRGAATTILAENIMGGTCACVCPVEELCEQVCVLNTAEDRPVVIGRLQRYATDHLLNRGIQPFKRTDRSGRRIAVVGAGPAGLACAHRLAMFGHDVTVFEARNKSGGLNEYGLAAYKMPNRRAEKEVAFILDIGGIEVRHAQPLGAGVSLDALRRDYDAVFLGVGQNSVRRLGLDNENAAGVHDAVHFIERIRQDKLQDLPVGRNVVVIGGGNTAIDIAVQIKKLGAESVTIVYRRGRALMPATAYEQQVAQTNGVLIRTRAQPLKIHTRDGHLASVEFEYTTGDRRLEGTGETFVLPADQLFKAIGQLLDTTPLQTGESPDIDNGRIVVDEQRRTSLPGVWAGGDCTPGHDLTVIAVQDGKVAAHSIDEYLKHG